MVATRKSIATVPFFLKCHEDLFPKMSSINCCPHCNMYVSCQFCFIAMLQTSCNHLPPPQKCQMVATCPQPLEIPNCQKSLTRIALCLAVWGACVFTYSYIFLHAVIKLSRFYVYTYCKVNSSGGILEGIEQSFTYHREYVMQIT